MGDRSYGWIELHGVFPAEHVDELADILHGEYAWVNGGDHFDSREGYRKAIREAVDVSGKAGLYVEFDEISGGECDRLTGMLHEVGVAYRGFYDACGGAYGEGRYRWSPGELFQVSCVSHDGVPVATLDQLKEALAAGTLAELIAHLEWITGADMPPFSIGGPLTRAIEKLGRNNGC